MSESFSTYFLPNTLSISTEVQGYQMFELYLHFTSPLTANGTTLSSFSYERRKDVKPTDSIRNILSGDVIAAVPEPASWAMMIGGFGLVGASLRRRRQALHLA